MEDLLATKDDDVDGSRPKNLVSEPLEDDEGKIKDEQYANAAASSSSNYLERRKAKLLSNATFLHSLGFVAPTTTTTTTTTTTSSSTAIDSANTNENDQPDTTTVRRRRGERGPGKKKKRVFNEDFIDECFIERRRTTRQLQPLSLFSQEDWSKEAARLRQNLMRRNKNARLGMFSDLECNQPMSEIEQGCIGVLQWTVFALVTLVPTTTLVPVAPEVQSEKEGTAADPQKKNDDDSLQQPSHAEDQQQQQQNQTDDQQQQNQTDDQKPEQHVEESEIHNRHHQDDEEEEEDDDDQDRSKESHMKTVSDDIPTTFRILPKRSLLTNLRPESPPLVAKPTTKSSSPPKRTKRVGVKLFNLIEQRDFTAKIINEDEETEQHFYDCMPHLRMISNATQVDEERMQGTCEVRIPEWLLPGNYRIEFASAKRHVVCSTERFTVREIVGASAVASVGVWCVCGKTHNKSQSYTGMWVCCSKCAAWQHWSCYTQRATLRAKKKAQKAIQQVYSSSSSSSCSEDEGANGESQGPIVGVNAIEDRYARRESRAVRQAKTELLASQVLHSHLLVPPVLPSPDEDFCCWACQPLEHLQSDDNPEAKEAHYKSLGDRVELMVNMIEAASNGYIRKYLPSETQPLCVTPVHVVKFLKTLLLPTEKKCMDLGSGLGSFAGALPKNSFCIEIDSARCEQGKKNRPDMEWVNINVLSPEFYRNKKFREMDLIISNPDFEVGLAFICVALALIRNSTLTTRNSGHVDVRDGRIIMLLPSDFFEASVHRSRIFKLLDFRIEKEYKLGHLCFYTEQGKMGQKLTCDSLFILKPGRGIQNQKFEHKVINAKLAGML